ncbi:hypothetical protein FFM53_029005 (plasmid) [Rhizobium indicum]|uniref:Uncharacterized protein n=1 Tax=Rhizobium indicum TaxID=2583231 RepID=A0ABX6PLT4_9HYPH|nr:hypothetical protein FFM53_029005 [Rhizobium indicum]
MREIRFQSAFSEKGITGRVETSGLDADDRILLREARASVEHFDGDRIRLETLCPACKRLLGDVFQEGSATSGAGKLAARQNPFKLRPDLLMGRTGALGLIVRQRHRGLHCILPLVTQVRDS